MRERFIVTDKQDNLIAEFKNIRDLRAFFKEKIEAGEQVSTLYEIEKITKYSDLLIWDLVIEPSNEY